MAHSEHVFTAPQLAEHLHCSQSALRNWMSRNAAPSSFRMGDPHTGRHRFKRADVDAWLADSPLYVDEATTARLMGIKHTELRRRRLDGDHTIPPHTLTARGKAYYPIHKLDGYTVGLITAAEACELLGVNQSTMSRWRSKGIGPKWLRPSSQGKVFYDATSVHQFAKGGVA